jgi:hypothetical protein
MVSNKIPRYYRQLKVNESNRAGAACPSHWSRHAHCSDCHLSILHRVDSFDGTSLFARVFTGTDYGFS